MQTQLSFSCKNQHLILSGQSAVFWQEQQTLLLADLHLGKSGHFRKAGIALPNEITAHDLKRLGALLNHFQPVTCIFLGDLFHSDFNKELLLFKTFVEKHSHIKFILVEGNHDIVNNETIKNLGITAIHQVLNLPPFQFTHHPKVDEYLYNIAGHIHPGYRLRGHGRQSVSMPVFYFGNQQAILPAFGTFCGKAFIEPKEKDKLFGIVEQGVMEISAKVR